MESNNKMYGYERHSKDTDHKHCLDVEILHIMTDMKDVRFYYTYGTRYRTYSILLYHTLSFGSLLF